MRVVWSQYLSTANWILDESLRCRTVEESLDDEPFMKGYNLDVDQLVCNELLLSLPMKVLCREDCKGIW